MGVTAIVGANWGDEGKGKMTDYLAASSDVVVRYQGGANAGHTIINEHGKFALHLLPSGVFHPHVMNVIGPGVALDPRALVKELQELASTGITKPLLAVSERAQLLMPLHRQLDAWEEEYLAGAQFGSTRSGIAPFYADKYAKVGIQAADLRNPTRLRERVRHLVELKNVLLTHRYNQPPLDPKQVADELLEVGDPLLPYLTDTHAVMREALRDGLNILLEGQLGALRDPDHGIFPFSTSSSTLAGFATVGAGLPPWAIDRVVAVVKAYSSCVGAGPFVTELSGSEADTLRERGGDRGEYGATTGRPRRVGWIDLVATRYGCSVQGATEVALTNLDVLGYLDEIPLCDAYVVDGAVLHDFPVTSILDRATPHFVRMPGWKRDIRGEREYDDLPQEAKAYVAFVERQIGVTIRYISTGPHRDDLIIR